MVIARVQVEWGGLPSSPGLSQFFADFGGTAPTPAQVSDLTEAVSIFFDGIKTLFPTDLSLSISDEAAVINPANGAVSEFVRADSTFGAIAGTSSGSWLAASGTSIVWNTAGIRNGRRVRGRTFLVPVTSLAYDADGNVTTTLRNEIATKAMTMASGFNLAGGDLVIWSRPSSSISADGQVSVVTGASVPPRGNVLTGRRG